MRIVRGLGIVIGALLVIIGLVLIAARFHDGPLNMIAGGPLEAGERVTGAEPDWRFARDIPTVELQLLEPARSRTTWILELNGKIYVPCGSMNTAVGRFWKRWPREAERDGRALLRVDGKVYPRHLERIQGGEIVAPLIEELARKYQVPITPAAFESGYLWLFELARPRDAALEPRNAA